MYTPLSPILTCVGDIFLLVHKTVLIKKRSDLNGLEQILGKNFLEYWFIIYNLQFKKVVNFFVIIDYFFILV